MTEFSSRTQTGDAPETIEELLRFTLVCLKGYSAEAAKRMVEAEVLVEQALVLRDEAKAMFDRANQLAMEYAKLRAAHDKASPVPQVSWEDDIQF